MAGSSDSSGAAVPGTSRSLTLVRICFFCFTIAQIISIFGDRLHQFAVVGMIGKVAPGSSVELLTFVVFTHLPVLLFAPIFGSLIDRWNRITVLVLVDILRGGIVLLVPTIYYFMGNLYAFYVPVLFLSLANLLFSPAKSAAIPEYFHGLKLLNINAILWGLGVIGTLGGFLLGGWLFDYREWAWGFYVDGISYLVSAVFILPLFLLRPHRTEPHPEATPSETPVFRSLFRSIREGLAVVHGDRRIASCLTTQAVLFAALGALYTVGIARIQTVFPSDKTMYLSGVATAGTIGLLAGAGLTSLLRSRFGPARMIAASTTIFGVSWIGIGLTQHLMPMMLWTLVMGFSISPIFVLTETLLQSNIPVEFRGRVFSTREVVTKIAFLTATAVATAATGFLPKATILIAVGVLLAVLGLVLNSKRVLTV